MKPDINEIEVSLHYGRQNYLSDSESRLTVYVKVSGSSKESEQVQHIANSIRKTLEGIQEAKSKKSLKPNPKG